MRGTMILSPSILAADFAALGEQIREVKEAGARYLHIDVMDGVFVPSISFGMPVIRSIRGVSDIVFDVHLMITEPQRYLQEFAACGADIITFHLEASENPAEVIAEIHRLGCRAGLSIKPATPVEALLPYLDQLDMVLVMTVEPGFGGQSFMADQMEKVSAIRRWIDRKNPACELEVDGGVAPGTCRTCIDAGANVLVAGSAVYKAADIPARVRELRG